MRGNAAAHEDLGPAILSWHRIAQDPVDPFGLCTAPEEFRGQLQRLRERHRILPLDDLLEETERGTAGDAIALTLDDGYADALEVAASLLAEAHLPATFYVTTAALDRPDAYFWDELAHLFLSGGALPPNLPFPGPAVPALDATERSVGYGDLPTRTAAERERAFRAIHARGVELGSAGRADLMTRLRAWAGERPTLALPLPLDEKGVRALAALPGCSVGAHGVDHLFLPHQSEAAIVHEVEHSRRALAGVLGTPPAAFAYPFGGWTPRVRAMVEAAGYSSAVTVEARRVAAGERWSLPRYEARAYLEAIS